MIPWGIAIQLSWNVKKEREWKAAFEMPKVLYPCKLLTPDIDPVLVIRLQFYMVLFIFNIFMSHFIFALISKVVQKIKTNLHKNKLYFIQFWNVIWNFTMQ